MNRLRLGLLVILALVIASPATTANSPEGPRDAAITILYTNDVHGHLFPFDYIGLGTVETDVGSAARRATVLRKIEAEADHPVLVMDAGDAFQRGPLQDLEGKPDFDVMNAVPYDVMTLGNNEFKGGEGSHGMEVLRARIAQARFPMLSANVFEKATGKLIVQPYTIFERCGVRIGVFGLTAPRTAYYEQCKDLDVKDPIEIAAQLVPELRQKTDFIIALSHVGYPLDVELAQRVRGIDVIIGGDSHTWLFRPQAVRPNAGVATIICQAGEWGKSVGRLDLCLRRQDSGRYEVSTYEGRLIDIDSAVVPAPDIANIVADYAKPFTKVVAKLDKAISIVEGPKWVAERIRQATGAQVGIMPVYAIERGLRAGPVTQLDIRRMFVYTDRVVKLKITGKQLNDYLSSVNAAVAGTQAFKSKSTYTVAVSDFYAKESPILSKAPSSPPGLQIREVIARYLSRKPAQVGR